MQTSFIYDITPHFVRYAYKFTGKERDTETGLDYFGARYYSNGLGRWVSADWSAVPAPVPYADFADPQSLNLYVYVRGLPTAKIDADGHCDDSCLAQNANNDASLIPHDLGTAAVGFVKQLSNIAIDTLHLASGGAISGGNPINGHDEQIGANAANAAVAVVPSLGEEASASSTANSIAGEIETSSEASATASIPREGIYEGSDATAPGKTYVGQSGDIPNRIGQHEASGKFAPGTKVSTTEVKGGKTAREIAEHNRIQKLGGVRSNPGSRTSNVRNPIGKNRQHLLGKKREDIK